MNKLRQWFSVQLAKNPARVVLFSIALFNIVFIFGAALIILKIAPEHIIEKGFGQALYYATFMILDPGGVENVIGEYNSANVLITVFSLATVVIGMILFTGAIIGYLTNYISNFISNVNMGKRKLHIDNHTVILNWNNRGSEIVNDMLYKRTIEKVVILVSANKEEVKKEIDNRISDTINRENQLGNAISNNLVVIVREGSSFSAKDLEDISLENAKTVIILSPETTNSRCLLSSDNDYQQLAHQRGNILLIKSLIQVTEHQIGKACEKQNVIVEVEDSWTQLLVEQIIKKERRQGRLKIYALEIRKLLGQVLSQFTIMPELNMVYSTLFSNRGATFFVRPINGQNEEVDYISDYFLTHNKAIPLTLMNNGTNDNAFFISELNMDVFNQTRKEVYPVHTKIVDNYQMETKHIIILGHNSKSRAIMDGFNEFMSEWNTTSGEDVLDIMVIDDKHYLERENYCQNYSYVNKLVEANIYQTDIIYDEINSFIDMHQSGGISVLILSDDCVQNSAVDANALTYLIYVQDIIDQRLDEDPSFNRSKVDIVIEILNPQNYDVVQKYNAKNVVISNRYISKMITQIGQKEELYNFYNDILAYDSDISEGYSSKEIYVKKVKRFFEIIPPKCTARQLMLSVFEASPNDNKSIALGYVNKAEKLILFSGDLDKIEVELTADDKIILFSNH